MRLLFLALVILNFNDLVFGYYFYNPSNQTIFKSSLKRVPKHFIRIRPARQARPNGVNLKRRHRGSDGYCNDPGFVCDKPFDKSFTSIFQCNSDEYCPNYFKCCNQKCFGHKICIQATASSEADGNCGKWPYSCAQPFPFALSKGFKCKYDRQCPNDYKCCPQNCFLHRICIKNKSPQEDQVIENIKERPEYYETETTTKLMTTEETIDEFTGKVTVIVETGDISIINSDEDDKKTHAIKPEYEEYYYHYDDDYEEKELDSEQ